MRAIMQPGASQYFNQAMQTLGTAMQAGARLQGAAMRWWFETLQKANSLQPIQHRVQNMMSGIAPDAQQDDSPYLSLFGRGYQTGMELMRRAFEPNPSASYFEAQDHMRGLWQEAFNSLHANARDLVQFHMRSVEIWTDVADRNAASGAKAAKACAQAAHTSTESKAKPGPRRQARGARPHNGKRNFPRG